MSAADHLDGFDAGRHQGWLEGRAAGYRLGYEEGRKAGLKEGWDLAADDETRRWAPSREWARADPGRLAHAELESIRADYPAAKPLKTPTECLATWEIP